MKKLKHFRVKNTRKLTNLYTQKEKSNNKIR